MNWGQVIADYYKEGLPIGEITNKVPFDILSVSSTIHVAMKNGLI